MKIRFKKSLIPLLLLPLILSGCVTDNPMLQVGPQGAELLKGFPVTNNRTPYSSCLGALADIEGYHKLPSFSVGEIADKTGTLAKDSLSRELTQGATEMLMTALYKTRKVNLQERFSTGIPMAEMKLAAQNMLADRQLSDYKIRPSDFVVLGALTELNYNIVSSGLGFAISGIGASGRMVIINVALDLRVVDPSSLRVPYVSSLQKQIYGVEVGANIFRFFGTELIELEGGVIRNEPLQLGVRSVVEMAVYQIMTDFLKLPEVADCQIMEAPISQEKLNSKRNTL